MAWLNRREVSMVFNARSIMLDVKATIRTVRDIEVTIYVLTKWRFRRSKLYKDAHLWKG